MNAQSSRLSADRAKILESALSAGQNRLDRLPGLAAIFERTAKALAEELERLSFLRPRVALADISVGSYSEKCRSAEGAVDAVVRADRWKGYVYFAADREVSMAFVEAVLGYDGTMNARSKPARDSTKTEISIITLLFKRLSRSLVDAFSNYVDTSLEIKSVANEDERLLVCRGDAPVIAARISIEYHDALGHLTIIVPQNLLDPFRDLLQSIPAATEIDVGKPADHNWARQISDEISRAFVRTTAVHDAHFIPLGEVATFKVGTIVPLLGNSLARVCLEVDDRPLFWCELGRQNALLALRIDEEYDPDQVQIEDT
jgi:flagellar motor switch protein FliM